MGARTRPGWIDHDVSDPGVTLFEIVTIAVGVVGVAVAVVAIARARRAS
jgi:hypothetical protein